MHVTFTKQVLFIYAKHVYTCTLGNKIPSLCHRERGKH